MLSLQEELSYVEIGQPSQFRNLTLFSLVRLRPSVTAGDLDYMLLEDSIAQGKVRVSELGGGGSVPELRVENTADLPILVVDGEELVGAKQNRVLNLTILVAPTRTTVIPVSCVEAGRWNTSSPDLKSTDHMMYSQGRAQCQSSVTESMRAKGPRFSNQRAIWRDIAAKSFRMTTKSATGAMSDIYEHHRSAVDEFIRAFAWKDGQAGVAFALAGRILGLDLFDRPETMRRLFPRLVRSYALDALDAPLETIGSASSEALRRFVAQIGEAQHFSRQALGLGEDVRFNGGEISGAALWAQGRYVHICAFAGDGETSQASFWSRISRPSRRRMF
jgi:hypothetical protein